LPADGVSETELLALAASLESKSEHPLAKAVLACAAERGVAAAEVENFRALPGNGLTAEQNGDVLTGGSVAFLRETVGENPLTARAAALADSGKTPLVFARNNALLGVIAVADPIKADSAAAIRELKNMGLTVVLLTGDNERTAKAVGAEAGVDRVIAGVLPDGKQAVIRDLQKTGKVGMVGDGINDAPALVQADVGIAIGAGTDVAIDAADVVLMKSSLADVAAAVRLSRATVRNIHQNLFWAFFYNLVCIPLAAGLTSALLGWDFQMNPMVGAAAMSLSSFTVCMNALRLNLVKVHDASRDKAIKRKSKNKKTEETTMTKTMTIEGMMCPHCEAAVKGALEALEGVTAAEVSHEKGTAVVTLAAPVADDVLRAAVEGKGYAVKGID
ncbi:MAG: metal-transporting ATPase, partial [Clostridia bacterium]|nr:metal-transporting ATPase [Clostridia bacterium]